MAPPPPGSTSSDDSIDSDSLESASQVRRGCLCHAALEPCARQGPRQPWESSAFILGARAHPSLPPTRTHRQAATLLRASS
jgi:hypothetical protein